jgi:ADP-ribose pyrophosphatase YjhB (NUDIX family)
VNRRFARLTRGPAPLSHGQALVPSDGMCLNAFLVLTDPADPKRVLLGRIAPDPRWEELGGLDPGRVARIGAGWMLPASQLLLFEAPGDAARRLARELLDLDLRISTPPQVFSDPYRRASSESDDPHWDLHFVYVSAGPARPPTHPLWRELRYVDVGNTPRAEFARGHGDVLELAGLPPRDAPASS